MTLKTWLRASVAACLIALPCLSGCSDPPITGPGGGASSGAAGSTDALGVGPPSGTASPNGGMGS